MSALRKILCVFLLAVAGCFLIGSIADKGLHGYWRPFLNKFDIAFKDSTPYDVVFLGNSTVHFGINPYYVDSVTGLNTFNLGYGGANIDAITTVFYGYMEVHPKPKAIVLFVDESSLLKENDLSNYFLFSCYVQNKGLHNYLTKKGYHVNMIRALPFLKYCFADEYNRTCIVKGFGESPVEQGAVIYKGFINRDKTVFATSNIDTETVIHKAPDPQCVAELNGLMDYCIKANIKILFVFPPRLYPVKNGYECGTDHTDTLAANTAARYGMPYKRFNVPGLFKFDEFTDEIHLNNNGAIHYSIGVGEYIDSALHAN
jgi:hypothetical protein